MRPALRLVSEDSSSFSFSHQSGNGQSSKSGNGEGHKPTILVVEDETLIRLATADFLRGAGYRVLEAGDAAEATLIIGAGEPIELVFTDINMPGQFDGNELAIWLQQKFPDVKIVLTSGVQHNTQRVANLKPITFIAKPYEYDELLQLLAQMLKLSAHG
jgi:CheY-like chemotaxis protein